MSTSPPAAAPTDVFNRAALPEPFVPAAATARWLREPDLAAYSVPYVGAVRLTVDGLFDGATLLERALGELRGELLDCVDESFGAADEVSPTIICAQPGSLELFALLGFAKPVFEFVTNYDRIRANVLKAGDDLTRAVKWFFRGMMVFVWRVGEMLHLPDRQPLFLR